MENNKKLGSMKDSKLHWTNERHKHYLNYMEASFVQSMFENNDRFLQLDRYVPDMSDSTQDLKKQKLPTHSTSGIVESSGKRMDKKVKTLSSSNSSQDQVVPQFQNKRCDRDKNCEGSS